MFGLGKRYCQVCGMEVEKGRDEVRFGKSFCSEEHATKYVEERKKAENLERQMSANNRSSQPRNSGGCC